MKLNQEGVEKAEAAMALANPYSDTYAKDRVTAALTAYFDHLKEVGLMREAGGGDVCGSYWFADTEPGMWENAEFKAVIIKVEEPNAKA